MPEESSIQAKLEIKLSDEDGKELVSDVMRDIETAWDDSSEWRDDRTLDYQYEQGLIGKANPDLPYPGAPNIKPLTSMLLKREAIGAYVNSVFNAPHLVKFSGGGAADTKQQEFCDWLLKSNMRGFRAKLIAAASRFLGAPGNCVIKVTHDRDCQKQTRVEPVDKELRMMVKMADAQAKQFAKMKTGNAEQDAMIEQAAKEAKDAPLALVAAKWGYDLDEPDEKKLAEDVLKQIRDPKEDVVAAIIENELCPIKLTVIDNLASIIVPKGTLDHQDAPWIAECVLWDERGLREAEASGKFKNVDEVISRVTSARANGATSSGSDVPSEIKLIQDYRDIVNGLTGDDKGSYPIFEVNLWLPRKKIERFNGTDSDDNTFVRAIMNFCPYLEGDKAILRIMEHPYDFGGLFNWPYVQIRHNDTGDGWYCGRGYSALIRPFESEEIETLNAAIVRDIMASSPIIAWNANVLTNDTTTPEQRRLPGTNIDVQGDPSRLMNIFQMPDLATPLHAATFKNRQRAKEIAGLADSSLIPNYDRPPTKGQVAATLAPSQGIQGHEIQTFLDGWSDVFRMMFLLLKQFYFVGTDGEREYTTEKGDKPEFITRADFNHAFTIRAGGEPSLADDAAVVRNAIAWVQMFANNPAYAGFVSPADYLPDLSALMIGAARTQKWTKSGQAAQQNNEKFLQYQAQAAAAAEANKKKRDGKVGAAPAQMGGENMGNMSQSMQGGGMMQ